MVQAGCVTQTVAPPFHFLLLLLYPGAPRISGHGSDLIIPFQLATFALSLLMMFRTNSRWGLGCTECWAGAAAAGGPLAGLATSGRRGLVVLGAAALARWLHG